MKDARFKELLNLHLDHRLSAAEAEELELALKADPARRKALRDYEAMQSACATLFAKIEARAPSSLSLSRSMRAAETRIDNPRAVRDGWAWATWGITGGLAACVALVVARLSQPALPVVELNPSAARSVPAKAASAGLSLVQPSGSIASSSFGGTAVPRQVTFAALGLGPETANADSASRWILQADETGGYAAVEPSASHIAEPSGTWRGAVPASVAPAGGSFSSRPINAWVASPGGHQVENASYRFER